MDVYSCMYAPKELVKQLLPFLSRPLVLCEYSHAMGNSCGDLKDYWRILGDSPKFVGGFIWEMINHSIIDGDKVLYGGDFGDNQNDSNFCMDGLVSIDRKPFTESLQVREVYAPIKVIENETNYTIKNKYFFATLKDISCNLSVTVNGKITDEYNIDITKIPPQGEMIVPKRVLHLPNGYAYINFVFEKNGERVATCQFERKNALIEQKCFDMKPINTTLFDSNGLLKGMSLNMYRAPLDNDMTTKEVWKRASIDKAVFFPISKELVGDSLIVEGKIVTDFMSPLGNMKIIYRAYNNSSLNVDVTAHLEDFLLNKQSTNKGGILKNNVDYIPRFGFTFAYDKKDIFSVSYFGRGKQEAYVDRNLYAPIGLYTSKPSEMFVS
ncbi:MAG: glycoside hydrolase family 2 TIM barrel-domain containing protein, partial [Clostridia bacterium]